MLAHIIMLTHALVLAFAFVGPFICCLIFRVDPKETSDVKRTPMKIAADNNYKEIVEILREAIGEEIPDDVKLSQLSKAMYEDDPESPSVKENAKNKFRELLSSLSPELVRLKIIYLCTLWKTYVHVTGEQYVSQ